MLTSDQSLTILLPPDTLTALRADAAIRGKDASFIAAELLTQQYATRASKFQISEDEQERWDSMTEVERQAEIQDIAEGFADIEAGRLIPFEEVLERARTMFGIEVALPSAAH